MTQPGPGWQGAAAAGCRPRPEPVSWRSAAPDRVTNRIYEASESRTGTIGIQEGYTLAPSLDDGMAPGLETVKTFSQFGTRSERKARCAPVRFFVRHLASHQPICICFHSALHLPLSVFLSCMISLYLAIDHLFFWAVPATVTFSFTFPAPTTYGAHNNASFNTHSCW